MQGFDAGSYKIYDIAKIKNTQGNSFCLVNYILFVAKRCGNYYFGENKITVFIYSW